MPGFSRIDGDAIRAIADYVLTGKDNAALMTESKPSPPDPMDLKYTMDGYNKFLDPDGYPAVAPPWGTLNAIDLNQGKIAWKIPFGEYPELAAQGARETGSENLDGGIVERNEVGFMVSGQT